MSGGIKRVIVATVLTVVIFSASLIVLGSWAQTPSVQIITANIGQAFTYSGTGPASSDVTIKLVSSRSIVPSGDQYTYSMSGLHISNMNDRFVLEAYHVKNLIVTGSISIISKQMETQADENGNCAFSLSPSDLDPLSQIAIGSGFCSVSASGEPADDASEVVLKVVVSRTVHTDTNGGFTESMDIPNIQQADGIYDLYQDDVLVAQVYVGVATPTPTPPPPSSYTYDLRPGWNLISVPLVLQNNDISSVFPPDVKSKIVTIWSWDDAAQNWQYYSEQDNYFYDYFPALTNLETGKAYWVEMSEPATLEIEGTVPGVAPASPIAYGSPWSFIGPTGLSSSTPDTMYPDAVSVWGWDQTQQNWVYHSTVDNYFNDYFPNINNVQPGYGYWVER